MRRLALPILLALLLSQSLPAIAAAATGPAGRPPARQLDGTWRCWACSPRTTARPIRRTKLPALRVRARWRRRSSSSSTLAREGGRTRARSRTGRGARAAAQPGGDLGAAAAVAATDRRDGIASARASAAASAGLSGAPRSRPYGEIDALLADAQATSKPGAAERSGSPGARMRVRRSRSTRPGRGAVCARATRRSPAEIDGAFWRNGIARAGTSARTGVETAATVARRRARSAATPSSPTPA